MKKTILIIIITLVGIAIFLFILTGMEAQNSQTDIDGKNTGNINVEKIAEGFSSPVAFVSPKDATGRMFVADQVGVIKVIDAKGQVLRESFLDLQDKIISLNQGYDERGLLGLAFHPNFQNNGRFFVYYSAPLRSGAPLSWNHASILSEFRISQDDPNLADKNSEKIIMRIDQPQANHNGGHIVFGPDGHLYIPLGDGGGANDVGLGHTNNLGNGQDIEKLLGKILRINVDGENVYSIPQDNPFVGRAGRDEIFAYGLRNPYHISFDLLTGELFAADVGQRLWEEVNIIEKGGNYGWNKKEGKDCFSPENPANPPATCATTGLLGENLIDPIIEYKNADAGGIGKANVGGYVYRGRQIPFLAGNYVFADFTSAKQSDGSIFSASNNNGSWSFNELSIANMPDNRLGLYIKGMGRDDAGELYILASENSGPAGNTGKIFKITPPQ